MAKSYKVNHDAIDRDFPAQSEGASSVVEDAPEDSTSSYRIGTVPRRIQQSNPSTGLNDPKLAIWLYTAVVTTAILFSSWWKNVGATVRESMKYRER